MIRYLAIRNLAVIESVAVDFEQSFNILTGETGAGKSILLDAFSLALGARGDGALVRAGQPQGQVTAVFDLPARHPARALAAAQDIDCAGELILRRIQRGGRRLRNAEQRCCRWGLRRSPAWPPLI